MELTAIEQKQRAIDLLNVRLDGKRSMLEEIDPRLWAYFDDIACNSSADPDDEGDYHNVYEILCAAKFLRMLDSYPFNKKKVQTVIKIREGEWRHDGRTWRHVRGGLKCPGTSGAQVYRWQPFQVFVLASVFGFYNWVNTRNIAGSKPELLPTECERDGYIFDYRRVCTEFVYFGPRKTDKTGLAAYIQFIFFFFEDDNSEIYCCANSSDQAKLLYSRTRQLIAQMDDGNRIRSTQTVTDWRQSYKSVHDSSVRPLSAGGKTKDGMFAQLCCADEFGSAPYTNGKSDMLSLVNVIQSSMGPRREPMTFITTTAGTISVGPFIEKLEAIHRTLLLELTFGDGSQENNPDFESDRRLALCLEPDEWEYDEEVILNKTSLRHKVNPMLGLIVQHASYDGWISEARSDQSKMSELISKYFNHYVSSNVTEWIKPDDIRPLQKPVRIEDCKYADGWQVICGMDFSSGDDLHCSTYLAVRKDEQTGRTEFFADMDAWVTERAMHKSSIRNLYERWIDEGWLHVCPGAVLQPSLPVDRIVHLMEKEGILFLRWGYDFNQAKDPINTLKAYIWEKNNVDPNIYVIPVSQTFASYNPAVLKIEAVVWSEPPLITFSMNPLWPWCFGNCAIAVDTRINNRKMLKRNPGSDACKVDPVQCLGTCFIILSNLEGSVQK